MIISVNGNPVNGIDVAKYQGKPNLDIGGAPDWLSLIGIKATDAAKKAEGMVDPQYEVNRDWARHIGVPHRILYCFLREPEVMDMSDQMAVFCQTVGRLDQGEAVMIDWERSGIKLDHILEVERVMNVIYPERWCMYVNDGTADMISWMNARHGTTPIVHPDWRAEGWQAADQFDAMVWQVAIADPSNTAYWDELHTLYPQASAIDVDWVRNPDWLDHICGM